MTPEREKEASALIDEMFNAPGLQPFIHTTAAGQKVITVDSAKGLMLALLESTDDAMQSVVDMIKQA